MQNTLYFQAYGLVSALGSTPQAVVNACRQGEANPQSINLPHSFETALPYYFVENNVTNSGPQRDARQLYQNIILAISTAIEDAKLSKDEIRHLGIFMGTSSNEIGVLEQYYQQDLTTKEHPYPLRSNGFGELLAFIAQQFAIQGPQYNFITACSSSANALIYAAQMINSGRISKALVVGIESFNYMSTYGFHAMMLLSKTHCRPFDKDRDGIVLGEGVGALILSKTDKTPTSSQPVSPYRFVAGANLCDTASVTSASTAIIAQVMQKALSNANLQPHNISAIKAHGTSTVSNDAAEGQAMKLVFGNNIPPFTSLKPYLGHTMGACGTIELICLLMCLQENFIPATPGFSTADESLNLTPLTHNHQLDSGTIMLNYFGFGGNNTTFIITNERET